MRLPNNLGLKLYVAIFAVFCLCGLMNLSLSGSEINTYYSTLFTLHLPARAWYVFAILDGIFSCLSVIPLTYRAFTMPPQNIAFFQWLFFLRLSALLPGNNYQYVVVKAAFHGSMLLGLLTLGVWAVFIIPSFKEHHAYAFKK